MTLGVRIKKIQSRHGLRFLTPDRALLHLPPGPTRPLVLSVPDHPEPYVPHRKAHYVCHVSYVRQRVMTPVASGADSTLIIVGILAASGTAYGHFQVTTEPADRRY